MNICRRLRIVLMFPKRFAPDPNATREKSRSKFNSFNNKCSDRNKELKLPALLLLLENYYRQTNQPTNKPTDLPTDQPRNGQTES